MGNRFKIVRVLSTVRCLSKNKVLVRLLPVPQTATSTGTYGIAELMEKARFVSETVVKVVVAQAETDGVSVFLVLRNGVEIRGRNF